MAPTQTWFDANAGVIGFAGLLFGLASLVTGIVFYVRSRKPKILGWQLISQTKLPATTSGMTIFDAEGKACVAPVLTILRVGNRGKAAIGKADFGVPISVKFGPGITIIAAALDDRMKLRVTAPTTILDQEVTFTPSLLNKAQWIEMQFITDGEISKPVLDAKVSGSDADTVEIAEKRKEYWLAIQIASAIVIAAFFVAYFFVPLETRNGVSLAMTIGAVLFLFANKWRTRPPYWAPVPRSGLFS
ncbi:hypothetical protein [Cryobacterium sp. MDB2-33-2]|uniref:hypothetical protein n=1 Tax=Cryobacterium sp. MDB2-33-2 TaxID=1259179 RepID=UPI00106D482A|nr:hypothetical protein [Cryobacterium sp. MDB2-33-2]TFC03361.1 hypothetical protein E3O59_15895 [Cryobacterium sp. MDB2-33-2]